MTITVQVKNTGPQLFQRLRAKYPQAEVRALNRAAVSARTAMVPPMAQDLGAKQGLVKDGIRTYQATIARPLARLAASLKKRLTLYELGAKGSKRGGVTFRGKRYPQAFIATMRRSGHTGVFERQLPTRSRKGKPAHSPALPIRELRLVSLGYVFLKYRELGRAKALEALAKNIRSELKFALSKS